MFSTLRQTFGDGDPLLSVEIVPPFAKDRTSMRTACERCRIQKSKCVSGENGCMLCVAKNRKCEYSVVSRPRRHASGAASGGKTSRNDDNIVVNQQKQSNQAGIQKRRSRAQTTRQSSPSSTSSSYPEDQMRVAPVPQPSLQDNRIAIPGPDSGVEDAQQLFFSGRLFPDSPGQVPGVFLELDPAAGDFFGSLTGPTALAAAAKLESGLDGGASAEASTTRGERVKHDDTKSVHTSPSANSLFEFAVDQMDFLMDDSRSIPTTMAPSAPDSKATTEAQPATHFLPPPDLDATSTSSSCSCMMTAVGIYEALQVQLVWGDPVAGQSPAPSPKSAPADSPYSSLSSWSGSGSGSGSATTCHTTPLMTQQTILQRQKTMLARFESLLGCGTCWSRPDFVMLMITMCDRILTSLEAVERFVCSRIDDTDNRVSPNSSATAAATAADPNSAMATSRAELDLPPLSLPPQAQQQPRVGAWQIDDDDELELVISLVKSRVTRLGNLIAMAEGTVSANAWLSHERLVQALRRRSNKLLISLSFRGFP